MRERNKHRVPVILFDEEVIRNLIRGTKYPDIKIAQTEEIVASVWEPEVKLVVQLSDPEEYWRTTYISVIQPRPGEEDLYIRPDWVEVLPMTRIFYVTKDEDSI